MNWISIGFIGYLIIMLGFGFFAYFFKRARSIDEFIVGERSFGPVLSAFGVATTLASGYAFIGLVGMGYVMGALALWQPILCPLFEFALWKSLASKIRNFSLKTNSLTVIELLSKLRGDPYNLIKIVGALLIGVFMFVYLAGNFIAGAKAASILNIEFSTAVVFSAVVVVAYTFLGGVFAVMWTDFIQGLLMVISFILIIIAALANAGGFGGLITALLQTEPLVVSWTGGKAGWALATSFMIWLGIAIAFLGQPHAVQKFIAIKDDKSIPSAALVSILFNSMRQYFPIIIGLSGRVIFPTISDPELVVPQLIGEFFPNIIGGLMLAAIFASIMSTTDSLLLQATSEISRNVFQLSIFKNLSQASYEWIVRATTVVIGGLALYSALTGSKGVFDIIAFAFVGLSSAIAPAMFLGFFWKKTTSWGILAGIVTGIASTIVWSRYVKPVTGMHEGVPAFLITLLVVLTVSLLTSNLSQAKAGEAPADLTAD